MHVFVINFYVVYVCVYQYYWISNGYSLWSDLGAIRMCGFLGC